MMDTCNDYFVHNLSSANQSPGTGNSSCIKGNNLLTNDGTSNVVNDLSSTGTLSLSGSDTTTNRGTGGSNLVLPHLHQPQHHHHHLLQHNSHPQHLIAPVAPTITNHHPQQPGKFTGNGATTSYSTSSSSSTGAHSALSSSSSVGNASTTATGGTLQATVYPIQQQPKQLASSPSPLDNLKASVITENPFEANPTAYHHHHILQGNYGQSPIVESTANNLWAATAPATGGGGGVTRNDHLSGGAASVVGGYMDNGSGGKVLMANANSGQVNFNANLTSNCVLGHDNVSFNGTNSSGYGDNGLVQGPNSNLGYSTAQHALYSSAVNYGTGGGLTDGQMTDYNNSSKCTYNSSASPIISNQTATSPFHHYNSAQPQAAGYANNTGGGAGSTGLQKVITNGGSSYASSNSMNSQMRSGNQSHSYDLSTATGQLEYQTQYQAASAAPPPSQALPPVDALGQRTYMDLSASKPPTSHSSYYPAQAHQVAPSKAKRYGVYEETTSSQYLMQDYGYNGYKSHPSLIQPAIPQMPPHAQQMSRGHYSRQSSGSATGSHQMDPKLYRRSYTMPYKGSENGMKAVHLNYPPQYGYAVDPMTGKRIANYPPPHHPPPPPASHHQMPIPNGYSDPLYDLESAKKKVAYSNPVHPGKYHYPYYEDYRMNPKAAPPPPPTVVASQYGLMTSNMPPIHSTARPNYYPNGYYQHHPAHQPPPGYNGGVVGAYYQSVPQQQSGGDLYANYMKSHPMPSLPKAMDQMDPHSAALGKYNRNCYYDTNAPPVGEKTYVDLEDQINSSKITKGRNGYPMDYPTHHQSFYDPHHPQGHLSYSNAKYCQDRYLYHPHPQSAQHYYPQAGGIPQGNLNPSQSHHMMHSSGSVAHGDSGKKINVREFLSSWNDDEEELGAAVGDGVGGFSEEYQQAFQKGLVDANLQRIQVGISIDKANVMDSTGMMNLPDIIIDIEKQQKPGIPEIDLTDDAPEETIPSAAEATTAEKLYVLESIDVPLSELNKYKHLNVINKLPENVVHLKEGGGESAEVSVMEMFNESELIHAAAVAEDEKSVKVVAGVSAVENSLKFIEDIESNNDFKNDFELNVEYESFPNEKSQDTIVSTPEPALAELQTTPTPPAEDSSVANAERKKSVIVAMNMKVKSEDVKRKKKLKKALKALKAQQSNIVASAVGDSENDDDVFVAKGGFKSLAKCCLDVINTKQFRRNAHKYLTAAARKLPAQDESPVPRNYKYLRRFDSRNSVRVHNPKSLREACAEVVIACNLVTIQEVDDTEPVPWKEGEVPTLRDLCEVVLQRNNFIINMDMDYCSSMDNSNEVEAKGEAINNTPLLMEDLDDNNNNNHFAMISGLTREESQENDEKDSDVGMEEIEKQDEIGMDTSFEAAASVPSAYLFHDDPLLNCDYFLAEADGGDQIQFSEEVVPVDPDRFKRKQLTDMLRLKYVHNKQNIHALDSRRMLLKKYFYYQKFVAMVKKVPPNSGLSQSVPVAEALKERYRRLMKVRLRWSKKSKTIVMESAVEQLSHPPPQIVIRPRAKGPPVVIPPALAAVTPQAITAAAHSDTILKLIREGIADRARKSSAIVSETIGTGHRADDKDDSDTEEVILVTLEKSNHHDGKRRRSGSRQSADQSDRIISIESVKSEKRKERKLEAGRVQNPKREKEVDTKRHRDNSRSDDKNESRPKRAHQENHYMKKEKPKFDDILLGIDNIYKDVKAKPKSIKFLRGFEQLEDTSMGSPSSVKSSSTTTSSSSGSSTTSTSSSSSKTSSSSRTYSKSLKSAHSDRKPSSRSSSSSSSSSGSTSTSRSSATSSSKCDSVQKRPQIVTKDRPNKTTGGGGSDGLAAPRRTSKLQEIVRKMGNRPGPKVFKKKNGSSGSTTAAAASSHEKLIIKTAVVQLERDGYIDKLGKLYT